ncbi:MAG TPA: glutamyl-tRNA reductase [Vicinamibacterales bacterium]|jgi:glutamyl-tRNA reductase
MHLLLLGVSHRTAPIELRERLDFSARGLDEALADLAGRPSGAEAAVLSTCNRAEVYLACENLERGQGDAEQFFVDFHRLPQAELRPHLYAKTDAEAARHLFRVAAGLDSLVVGEPQILGQVKDAYGHASAQQTTGPLLNRLFTSAFAAGKRVRTETRLAEGAVSVSYAAVALARKIFGDLKDRTVLVVGAGEMGKLTALHMKSQGIRKMLITSRTTTHAEGLAEAMEATVVAWDRLAAALSESDIVITATGASAPIISRTLVETAMRPRRHRPLFVIDIAVPRDVDPRSGNIEQVFLYNIDDLQAVVVENVSRRSAEVEQAEAIVTEEVDRFRNWMQSRGAIPAVVALRQRFESVRRAELERLEPKLTGLSPEARARVDEITRLIVEKLLINPTEQLKNLSDAETIATYTDVLNRLFDLSRASQPDASLQKELTAAFAAADHLTERPRRSRAKTSSSS